MSEEQKTFKCWEDMEVERNKETDDIIERIFRTAKIDYRKYLYPEDHEMPNQDTKEVIINLKGCGGTNIWPR